nr:type II toxin-antitoxin system HicA family toxin [Azotobacter beijerinckii]
MNSEHSVRCHRCSSVPGHNQFKHPTKPGRVTVPHPKSEIPKGTLHNILKQAGLK